MSVDKSRVLELRKLGESLTSIGGSLRVSNQRVRAILLELELGYNPYLGSQLSYSRSIKGRKTRKLYQESKAGKKSRSRYSKSKKGKEALRRYYKSPRGQATRKRYLKSLKEAKKNE